MIRRMICGVDRELWRAARHGSKLAYLARASLGQIRDDVDLLGGRKGPDDLADLDDELLHQARLICGVVRELGLQGDEGVDSLASELVGRANDGGLCDALVQEQRGLDLRGRQTVARDVDHICRGPCPNTLAHRASPGGQSRRRTIDAALNPDVPMLVTRSAIARVEHARIRLYHQNITSAQVCCWDCPGETDLHVRLEVSDGSVTHT